MHAQPSSGVRCLIVGRTLHLLWIHTSCVQTAKALARLHGCAGLPKPSLVASVISTIIYLMSWLLYAFAIYRNVPKFSDRQVWANSADPDQSLIRVNTVCNSGCIFWMHYPKEKSSCSTFRVIQQMFWVSEILGFLQYVNYLHIFILGCWHLLHHIAFKFEEM